MMVAGSGGLDLYLDKYQHTDKTLFTKLPEFGSTSESGGGAALVPFRGILPWWWYPGGGPGGGSTCPRSPLSASVPRRPD